MSSRGQMFWWGRFWACAAGLGVAVASASEQPGAAPTEPPAEAVSPLLLRLEELDQRLGKIEQMRGRFRQSRTIPMLRRPMKSSGTVLMRRSALRWDTLEPAPSTMLVHEGEIRLYYPESAILEIYSTSQREGDAAGGVELPVRAPGVASARLSHLVDRFTIAEIPASSFGNVPRGEMLGLELTPIDEQTGSQVKRVRVLIDTAVPMIRRVQITSSEGELTDIELFDLRFDQRVTEAEMAIEVPEGTLISRPMEGDLEDTAPDPDSSDQPGGSP